MDLTKKEIDFINKLISKHWLEYNNSHKDNKEDWELSLNLVKKLTIPVVSNSVICCPQCGNERLESTGGGWYICGDRSCDWGGKL